MCLLRIPQIWLSHLGGITGPNTSPALFLFLLFFLSTDFQKDQGSEGSH